MAKALTSLQMGTNIQDSTKMVNQKALEYTLGRMGKKAKENGKNT
jgi:hypothetical protein